MNPSRMNVHVCSKSGEAPSHNQPAGCSSRNASHARRTVPIRIRIVTLACLSGALSGAIGCCRPGVKVMRFFLAASASVRALPPHHRLILLLQHHSHSLLKCTWRCHFAHSRLHNHKHPHRLLLQHPSHSLLRCTWRCQHSQLHKHPHRLVSLQSTPRAATLASTACSLLPPILHMILHRRCRAT